MQKQHLVKKTYTETKVIGERDEFEIGQWEGCKLHEHITTIITKNVRNFPRQENMNFINMMHLLHRYRMMAKKWLG